MGIKLIRGYQDTRTNKEDFVLTPYIGIVKAVRKPFRIYGLSLTWGYYSIYLAIGLGLPKEYPTVTFKTFSRNTLATK